MSNLNKDPMLSNLLSTRKIKILIIVNKSVENIRKNLTRLFLNKNANLKY